MKKFSEVLLIVVLLSLWSGSGFAEVNDCRSIFVDVKQCVVYKAAGAQSGGVNMANANAEALCRKYASDPKDCVPGQMSFAGIGYYNLSECNANEYIAIACTTKDGRPYCRVACGDTQESADSKAIDECMDMHYLNKKGCVLKALEY